MTRRERLEELIYIKQCSMESLWPLHKLLLDAVDALEQINIQNIVTINCPDGIEGCAVLHKKRTPSGIISNNTLTNIDEFLNENGRGGVSDSSSFCIK